MTQDEWIEKLNRLADQQDELTVEFPDCDVILADQGTINAQACDYLARWCLARCGEEPGGITAPEWSCSYAMRRGETKASFERWTLGGYDVIGIFKADPDDRKRPTYKDGTPHPSERKMWDHCFIIPDMPVPENRDRPEEWKGLTKKERRAKLREGYPRRQLLDALALAHFARWLLENVPGETS